VLCIKIGVVWSKFNESITLKMLESAKKEIGALGFEVFKVVEVFGVYDAPLAVKRLFDEGADAVVVLGAIIKGKTAHDEVIAFSVAKSLQEISLDCNKPVGFGVVGPCTKKQAEERAEEYAKRAVLAISLLNKK
jgi:6,7-dimethyl-8-ribityllumazine synthase